LGAAAGVSRARIIGYAMLGLVDVVLT
jgi:hypothetical protein